MTDQLDIHGNTQPLTWDGEPMYSPETVKEGLFDPEAFEQTPGQLAIDNVCTCGAPATWAHPRTGEPNCQHPACTIHQTMRALS